MRVGERIKFLREKRKLSGTQLAIRAELDQSYLSKLEKGKAGFSEEGLTKIARALNTTVSDLFGADNVAPITLLSRNRVPLLDYQHAGRLVASKSSVAAADVSEYVTVDFERVHDLFALRIRGTSMLPEFKEGDVVIIERNLTPQPGDYVVASVQAETEGVFKRYKVLRTEQDKGDVYALVPLNDDFPTLRSDELEMKVVGTMIEHRKYRRT